MTIRQYRLPHTVIGDGAAEEAGALLKERGARRALVVCDKGVHQLGLVDGVLSSLKEAGIGFEIFSDVTPELPLEDVEKAIEAVRAGGFDAVVGVGGGSALDAAKCAAGIGPRDGSVAEYAAGERAVDGPGLLSLSIPTTAGTGAEASPNALVKTPSGKKAVISPHIIPDVAVLDATLTVSLPQRITAWTGVDALAHAWESLVARRSNPYSDMYAREAIRLIARSLRGAVHSGAIEYRREMLYASYLAGFCIAHAGTGLAHALAYPLGERYHLHHGYSVAIVLGAVMEYNHPACLEKMAELAPLLGEGEAASATARADRSLAALRRLLDDVGVPRSLREAGVEREALDWIAEGTVKIERLIVNNPRRVELNDVVTLLQKAY